MKCDKNNKILENLLKIEMKNGKKRKYFLYFFSMSF